ncbi:MAG: sulfur transferase domain-containing protein [Gammaproteobacteria bacterium]|nr:sulfur transferase domain-containing protein [Gammaproteobacteria bacterium]
MKFRTQWIRYFLMGISLIISLENAATDQDLADPIDLNSLLLNYSEVRPGLSVSGAVNQEIIGELKSSGFRTLIDLRTPIEGVEEIGNAARQQGLQFYNLPVGGEPPSENVINEFTTIIEEQGDGPILFYCGSANRAGLVWGMYRISKGVPVETAINEAGKIGMKPGREQQLRDYAQQLSNNLED